MKMLDSERRFVITNENEVNITTPNFNAKFLAPNSYACNFYGDLTRIRSLKKKKMIRLNVIFLKFFRLEIFSFFVVLHVNCKNYYFINNFLLLRILGIQNILIQLWRSIKLYISMQYLFTSQMMTLTVFRSLFLFLFFFIFFVSELPALKMI